MPHCTDSRQLKGIVKPSDKKKYSLLILDLFQISLSIFLLFYRAKKKIYVEEWKTSSMNVNSGEKSIDKSYSSKSTITCQKM